MLQLGFVVALAAATLTIVVQLQRTRGIRRRLLAIVIVAALLPASAVAVATLGTARDLLSLLDAPGVRAMADGGVGLARTVLDREQAHLSSWADSLVSHAEPRELDLPEGLGWELRDASGARTAGGGVPLQSLLPTAERMPGGGERTRRVTTELGTVLLLTRSHDHGRLDVVQVLPGPLAADLARVEEGSRGLLQLGLYYRELLGTRALVLATTALFFVALLSVWIGRVAGERLVLPLTDLVEGTRRVAGGDLDHRVRVRGVGEVSELVAAFNGMTARLARSEDQRRRSERLAAWQGIARRLAHEIKNPLTPIQLALHRIRRRENDPVTLEALEAIEQETRNLQRLAEEFSALGRLPEPQPQAVLLRRLLEEVVTLYVPDTVLVRWRGADDPVLSADPGQLRQVLANLVKNAVEAMGRRGQLRFVLGAVEGGRARWAIEDSGPGLPEPVDRVFEPGFTTRSTGSGLGLAIVQRIVEDHGARIEAGRAEGGGASFRLDWPVHRSAGASMLRVDPEIPRGSES